MILFWTEFGWEHLAHPLILCWNGLTHYLTNLLITVFLPHNSYFKAFLMWLVVLRAKKIAFLPLSEVDLISPRQIMIYKQYLMVT